MKVSNCFKWCTVFIILFHKCKKNYIHAILHLPSIPKKIINDNYVHICTRKNYSELKQLHVVPFEKAMTTLTP